MNIEEIYQESKPLVMTDCDFAHQIDDIMYPDKLKEEIKQETSGTTNIIVTKYADSTSDMLGVEPTLQLDKGKIIEVELLPSNSQHKNNFTLVNGSISKKGLKMKMENDENKKYSTSSFRKKKFCTNNPKECIKTIELVSKNENTSQEIACGDCNKQCSSAALLAKHLSSCKVQSFSSALCSKCGKNFSSNYNLKRHMTSCKLCPDNEKSPRYMCQCGRTYSQEWDMKKHKVKCKEVKKKCKTCLVADCNLLFYHKTQLISHLKKDHNMIIQDPKILNFNSFDEFLLWKEKEEEETFTYYSKQTGSNVSGVSVNAYYVCQHDGSDRSHSSTPRKTGRRNKKGRIKTGRLCWSQMNVKEFKDGTVKVTYFPSHTHPVSIADTEHHPLPSSIRMEIKRRITEMSKSTETEEVTTENPEHRKGKRKKSGMSLRALRALARKNRSLFRITAEAMEKTETKDSLDENLKSDFPLTSPKAVQTDGSVEDFATDPEDENADDPDSVQIYENSVNENECQTGNEELLEDCLSYLNDVKSRLLSGNLPQAHVMQIKESLKSICSLWQDEEQESQVDLKSQNPDPEEVMMYQPQSPMPATEIFPLQNEINPDMEINEDFKQIESSSEKAVYQIIAVDGQEKSPNEFSCQNSVPMIGPREFIIIAGDHAQLFQSVDSNVQFGLY